MQKNKILHVMILDKFLAPYIDFIDTHFGREEHHYVFITSEKYTYGLTPEHQVEFLYTDDDIFTILLRYMKMARKIILHGLWRDKVNELLHDNPELLKKCYWVVWGGDLYTYILGERTEAWHKRELFRSTVIRNVKCITTTVPGDFELTKQWYSTEADFVHNLMYPSHLYRDSNSFKCQELKNDDIYIQIGNSADPTNNHLEIIKLISKVNLKNYKIFCPLSYGNSQYRDLIIKKGREAFGDKFIPLVDFMSFDDYNNYMACIDIAIFNHNRQQAMGNIIGLLSLGKKVVIKSTITPYAFFKDLDIKVYTLDSHDLFKTIPIDVKKKNISLTRNYFNKKKLYADWKKIFNE
ncbi:MAG: TDP-N-acetylfucosamine:lipid II N-acetylfucosaminyltransferase [Arcobacteraceae bacterium]